MLVDETTIVCLGIVLILQPANVDNILKISKYFQLGVHEFSINIWAPC